MLLRTRRPARALPGCLSLSPSKLKPCVRDRCNREIPPTHPVRTTVAVRDTLEELVAAGKIRFYGWSTDFPERAKVFAEGKHNVAVQHELSVFFDAPEMLRFCEERRLASIDRSPLAMGVLTGKFDEKSRLNGKDVRGVQPEWLRYFDKGQPKAEWLERLAVIRKILGSDGRTPTQGALAWIWTRSPQTIPIPGFRTVKQVEENVAALRFGPLSDAAAQEISGLLIN